MSTITFLIFFPMLAAFVLLFLKNDAARKVVVIASAALIMIGSVYFTFQYFHSDGTYFDYENKMIGNLMMAIELLISLYIFVVGIKYKKYLASILVIIQAPIMVWFELKHGHGIHVANNLYVDRFSLIMVLIIGIIGSAICIYALGYMKDFHHHHHEMKDKRPFFFFLLFIFLSAMFGIVLSNNLIWLYFFWEITTVCSFLLIGYTRTAEAIKNSFKQIILNLLGGIGFALGIVFLGLFYQTVELNNMIMLGTMGYSVVVPAVFIAFAGLTKAAQMPFHYWLLGAMVAPTPTSALLHSSTMVKAGVFIIIKLAPVLGFNPAGIMVMTVGGITFLVASCIAITQSNAKRVLAYSTVANLGLIVICAGIGTAEAVWAAILLVIFHACAKSLLFLSVGTVEHNVGSRDIEDMDGLFVKMPKLAKFMVIGICGMFLAPFGMLISKWAAMKAIIDSGNFVVLFLLVFGSSVTLFFWVKWLGKIIAVISRAENIESAVNKTEWFSIGLHAVLTVGACLFFPLISSSILIPYLETIYGSVSATISQGNMYIMVFMLALLIILALAFFGKSKKKIVPIYMAGVNLGDNETYQGSMGVEMHSTMRNWYMTSYFNEHRMNLIGTITTSVLFVIIFAMILGGVL